MTLQHLRSSTANKRPDPTAMADGQIALNTAAASPGLFYKDSAGNLVKAGPVHVGSTAPNVSPASGGTAGNSTGEAWLDTSGSNPLLKIWSGAAWQTVQPVASGTVVSTADTGSVTSTMIANGTIVDADVNASAAIAGTKVSPNFGSQTITTTGVVSAAAGAAATPSITFTGDLNTGIYSPGADQVAISTGGSGRLFVASDGKIGIGSSGSGTQSARTFIEGSGACPLEIDATAGSGGYLTLSNSGSAKAFFGFGSNIGTASVNDIAIRSQSGALAFQTGGANERLRITSAGLVGIGTSSPAQTLHVVGRSQFQPATGTRVITLVNTSGGDGSIEVSGGATSMNYGFSTYSTSNALYIQNDGKVGIGTTSPSARFQVESSAASTLVALSNPGVATIYIGISGQSENYYDANTQIFRSGNSTERMRIDSSGRLLVGTSSARSNFFNTTQSANIQLEGIAGTALMSLVSNHNDSGGNSALVLGKTRGTTVGSTTVVQSGDILGRITFQGSDGTEFVQAADIYAEVDGTPGANDMPGRLVFSTTADGASSPTEHFRINEKGTFHFSNSGSYSNAGGTYNEIYNTNSTVCLYARNTHSTIPYGHQIYYDAAPNNTSSEFLYCSDVNAQRAAIRSNGGFANYQANNVNLSDINTKKDISPAVNTWDCIKEWEIVNYRYKDQPDDADLNLGVIAQQVAESCPEVVTVFEEAKDDQPEKLGVKEQQMYWMAIKALQEAQVRIEQLEAKVAALESA